MEPVNRLSSILATWHIVLSFPTGIQECLIFVVSVNNENLASSALCMYPLNTISVVYLYVYLKISFWLIIKIHKQVYVFHFIPDQVIWYVVRKFNMVAEVTEDSSYMCVVTIDTKPAHSFKLARFEYICRWPTQLPLFHCV
jgi:hypothetical protein